MSFHRVILVLLTGKTKGDNMKKVYLVRGSEDGTLGIYSNFKAAYEAGKAYQESGPNGERQYTLTYSKALKVIRESNLVHLDDYRHTYYAHAIIESFDLESKF